MSREDVSSVEIPNGLRQKISKKIEGTEFKSVSEYVIYVLEEVLNDQPPKETYSKEDQERIESRLRELGYV